MTGQSGSTTAIVDHVESQGDDGGSARPMRADARRNGERLVTAARAVFAQQGGAASMDAIA